MTERSIRQPLSQQSDDCRCRDGDRHDGEHGKDGVAVEETTPGERGRDEISGEGPRHHDVAMGEIDEAQNAVDHGVAERHQGVDAAHRDAKSQEFEPLDGAVSAFDQGADTAADHHHEDADAQRPQDDVDEGEAGERPQSRDKGPPSRDIGHRATPCFSRARRCVVSAMERPALERQGQIFFGFTPILNVLGSPSVNS